MQRTIELSNLSDEQIQALERLAVQEHRSVNDVVQLAIGDYLARRMVQRTEAVRRFRETVERIQARIPPDVTPEQIEADITAAAEELRAERAAQRTSADRPSAGGH